MIVQHILPAINPAFRYHTHIKDCWLAGKLPSVKVGAYGFKLTKKTVSNEHIIPASMGGTLSQGNILLADKYINNLRGCEPIEEHLTKSNLLKYLAQFIGIKVKHKGKTFNGDKYIEDVLKTTSKLNLQG